jgi:hypothetical protein
VLKKHAGAQARRSEAADALKSSAEGVWEVKVGCGLLSEQIGRAARGTAWRRQRCRFAFKTRLFASHDETADEAENPAATRDLYMNS